jgi:outer membrane protein TolC
MKKLKILAFALFIFLSLQIKAQKMLSFDAFKERVLKYHPVVRQSQILIETGEKEVLKAKGMLDPSFSTEIETKQFDEKEYYNLSNSGLKIPTWFGVDFKAGYEINRGEFVSKQNSTPLSGLWFAGIEVPLGQGLLFDERRETILRAKIFQENSKNEQELVLNDLLLDAYSTYWSWYEAYQKMKIADEGLTLAEQRFQAVKQNALLGEIPTIDTVEAKIQLDYRRIELLENTNNFKNVSLFLSLFLWSEDFVPLELDENTFPNEQITRSFDNNTLLLRMNDSLSYDLPLLMQTMYKIDQLKIEERWKREQLKPQINLSYNPLSQPVGNNPIANFSPSNYKFGLSVYVPLFLRKERGSLAQTKLKIENTNLDLKYKIIELTNKEIQLRNDLLNLYAQLEIQQNQVSQGKLLRDSEQKRFEIGESSLFLVNSREISYLTFKVKLAEIEAKMKISEAKWLWLFSELN